MRHAENPYFVEEGHVRISIYYAEDSEGPRMMDPLGTLCLRRLRGGLDEDPDLKLFLDDEQKVRNPEVVVMLPVYRFQHSGVIYSTSPSSDRWDSGRAGFIVATKEKIRERFGFDDTAMALPENVELVTNILKAEINMYSAWCNGEVFEYDVESIFEGVIIDRDSGCGYYSIKDCKADAEDAAKHLRRDRRNIARPAA